MCFGPFLEWYHKRNGNRSAIVGFLCVVNSPTEWIVTQKARHNNFICSHQIKIDVWTKMNASKNVTPSRSASYVPWHKSWIQLEVEAQGSPKLHFVTACTWQPLLLWTSQRIPEGNETVQVWIQILNLTDWSASRPASLTTRLWLHHRTPLTSGQFHFDALFVQISKNYYKSISQECVTRWQC